MDNSDFITIHVTNEVGEEKEIDHIKDRDHHHQTSTGGGSSSTNVAAAATVGKGPNEHHQHISPSTSGHDKYLATFSSTIAIIFINIGVSF